MVKKKKENFTELGGFCLVVEAHQEGCATNGASLFSLGPQLFFCAVKYGQVKLK